MDNLSDVEQRVKRYWFVDGFGELVGGAMFLLLGLYFSAQQYFGDRSLVGGILQMGFIVIFVGGVTLARKLISILKMRFTYPRTGYVEYPQKDNVQHRLLAIAVAVAVAIMTIVIARRFNSIDSLVAVSGLLVAVILLVKQGLTARVQRFYVLGLLSVVIGFGLSTSGFPRGYNLGLYYGLMGSAFAISGAITLAHYLRENPLPAETQND